MKYALLGAALLLSAVPSAAQAQAADFLGPRLHVLVGWDEVSYKNFARDIDDSKSGIAFGLASGYDFPIGTSNIVGIGASGIFSSLDKTVTRGADRVRFELKRDLELAVRAGTIINDQFLVYGKVGYANAKAKVRTTIGGIEDSDNKNVGGLRVAVGSEISITEPLAAVIEYRYTDYEKGFTRNQVLAGVSYRF